MEITGDISGKFNICQWGEIKNQKAKLKNMAAILSIFELLDAIDAA